MNLDILVGKSNTLLSSYFIMAHLNIIWSSEATSSCATYSSLDT